MEVFFTSPGHWCLHRERSIMGETRFFLMAYMFRLEPTCHVSNRGWAHCFLFLIFLYLFLCGGWGVGGVGNGYFLVRHVLPSHFYSL